MPSVYNYRHVELDKVGRGKRVIQPPGGQTADIFGSRAEPSYSSASSQAGSDVASSRMHMEADQHSIGGNSSIASSQQQHLIVDGMMNKPQAAGLHSNSNTGHLSPNGSIESGASSNSRPQQQLQPQQPLLMADDFKPTQDNLLQQGNIQQLQQQQQQQQLQQPMHPQQQKLIQMQQQEVNRSPKKTIPVIRRNPITGEIYDNPTDRQQAVIRVRQPPGGRSSGIF